MRESSMKGFRFEIGRRGNVSVAQARDLLGGRHAGAASPKLAMREYDIPPILQTDRLFRVSAQGMLAVRHAG